jgi:integrase
MPRKKAVRHERAHGQGSIRELPGGKVRAWRPPQDGRRVSKTFSGPTARFRAERWLAGLDVGSGVTVALWFETWYARRAARLRPNTRRNYQELILYLADIQDRPLADLTADDWQRTIDQLLTRYGRGTIASARSIWSGALAAAVREGLLSSNPLVETRLPRETEQPPKAWRSDEVARLLAGADESAGHYRAFLHLALSAGLRLGELRALEWSDLDLREMTVTIARSLDNATAEAGPTKSGRVRVVDLPAETAELLAEHRKHQPPACRLVLGRTDGPYDASTFRAWLRRLCVHVGVTPLPPHSARHTFASLAIAAGVSIPAVSAALGHANAAITGRVYAHFIEQQERRTATALGAALYGSPGTSGGTSARDLHASGALTR